MIRLNLGCGRRKREGWVNVDSNPGHRPDVLLDLRDPWPWEPGTVDAIESYHVIEHLSLNDGRELLAKCHLFLRAGGTVAIECPNLAAVCANYASKPVSATRSIYGLQQRGDGMRHRYGYSRQTLAREMIGAGFKVIHVGDGTDYHAAEEPCIRVEGVKP